MSLSSRCTFSIIVNFASAEKLCRTPPFAAAANRFASPIFSKCWSNIVRNCCRRSSYCEVSQRKEEQEQEEEEEDSDARGRRLSSPSAALSQDTRTCTTRTRVHLYGYTVHTALLLTHLRGRILPRPGKAISKDSFLCCCCGGGHGRHPFFGFHIAEKSRLECQCVACARAWA